MKYFLYQSASYYLIILDDSLFPKGLYKEKINMGQKKVLEQKNDVI